MSSVRRHSIKEEEESSSKSGVVLSDHSSSAAYFTDPKVAKLLRCHADREEKKREDDANDPEINKKDKMLSHPKDGS